MANRIQIRGDSAANWSSTNPVLAAREIGMITGSNPPAFKVGDGITAWNALPFYGMIVSSTAPSSPYVGMLWLDIS